MGWRALHAAAAHNPAHLCGLTCCCTRCAADCLPPLSVAERRQALEAAAQHALSRGITCVHDMGRIAYMEGEEAAWSDLQEVYSPAADAGRLPLRVYAFVALPTWCAGLAGGAGGRQQRLAWCCCCRDAACLPLPLLMLALRVRAPQAAHGGAGAAPGALAPGRDAVLGWCQGVCR